MNLFNELKRRNVFRVGLSYLVIAWLIAQVADMVLDNINAPTWVMQAILLVMGLGFIVALIIAWAYELTPEGIKKEKDVSRNDSITNATAKKLDYITIAAAIAVIGMIIWQQMSPRELDSRLGGNDTVERESSNNETTTPVIPAKVIIQSATNKIDDKSIAVLPFVNMSSDKDQEYFADGISEEILNALVKATGLRVAGRTSSFSFKGKDTTIKQIGAMLKVAYVLEGSVRKQNQQVRITAQLIKADDGFHLWSETYDGSLENIFDLQEEISRKVTQELKLLLNFGSNQRLASKMTNNIDAYDLFLRGREKVRKRINNNIPEGIALLQQAVELDPNFAHAWAKLAEAEAVSLSYTNADGELANARAQEHLSKALKINNNLALAYAVKGLLRYEDSFMEGISYYSKALKLEPKNSLATRWLGNTYSILGLDELALPLYKQAYELDPLSSIDAFNLATINFKLDNLEEAIRYFQIAGNIRGEPMTQLSYIYDNQGHTQKAIDYFLKAYEIYEIKLGTQSFMTQGQAEKFALGAFSGTKEQQQKARNIYASLVNDQRYWQLSDLLSIDNIDRAFEILQSKPLFFYPFAADDMWLPLKGTKKFRADPRFITLMRKYKLPTAWQKLGWPKYCQPYEGTDGSYGQFQCQ